MNYKLINRLDPLVYLGLVLVGFIMPEVVYRRAKHIITENARTLTASHALKSGDIETVSTAMAQSHVSMRDDFEITVSALHNPPKALSTTFERASWTSSQRR